MNALDLFSGIGGFSLGLERAGMRTVAFCEIDPFCRRVLAKHWPGVPCYDDVRGLTAERLAADGIAAEVICGGFPCQDISSAGRGAGIEGERSGLWKEYARIIGEVRPRYVIVENVAALLGRGLDVVLRDLAALGFDAEWHCIPASAIGAPHRRDRVWIVANARHRVEPERPWSPGRKTGERPSVGSFAQCDGETSLGNAPIAGLDAAAQPGIHRIQEGAGPRDAQSKRRGRDLADAERGRLQGGHVECTRAATIIPAALSGHCGGSEFGAPWWTEPDLGRVAYGVPDQVDRLSALGNAVVPQIPEIIGRAIMNAAQPISAPPLTADNRT